MKNAIMKSKKQYEFVRFKYVGHPDEGEKHDLAAGTGGKAGRDRAGRTGCRFRRRGGSLTGEGTPLRCDKMVLFGVYQAVPFLLLGGK